MYDANFEIESMKESYSCCNMIDGVLIKEQGFEFWFITTCDGGIILYHFILTFSNISSYWYGISKVGVPNLVIDLNHIPIFEWYIVQCGSKNKYHKIHVFERDWTLCLVWVIYYKVDSQKGGGAIWPFNKDENLHFGNE